MVDIGHCYFGICHIECLLSLMGLELFSFLFDDAVHELLVIAKFLVKMLLLLLMMLQLINNVTCVFMKFVNEGKCTIRLCEPPVDVCVSKVNIQSGS